MPAIAVRVLLEVHASPCMLILVTSQLYKPCRLLKNHLPHVQLPKPVSIELLLHPSLNNMLSGFLYSICELFSLYYRKQLTKTTSYTTLSSCSMNPFILWGMKLAVSSPCLFLSLLISCSKYCMFHLIFFKALRHEMDMAFRDFYGVNNYFIKGEAFENLEDL